MSSMHWEKRNREHKQSHLKQVSLRRVPGWKDRPTPLAFKKWPTGSTTHDNAGAQRPGCAQGQDHPAGRQYPEIRLSRLLRSK